MNRLLFILFFCLLYTSCRKDLVRWKQVEQIKINTPDDRLNEFFFLNDSIGFVVGGQRFGKSTILKTDNGGTTWHPVPLPAAGKGLYGITAAGSGALYAIGFDGILMRSDDTGRTWNTYQLWYLPNKDLAFFNDTAGLAVGGVSFYAGYRTVIHPDGTFGSFDSLAYELNDIEKISEKEAFISGYGIVLKTQDAGASWHVQAVKNDNFTAVRAFSWQSVWTCGYNGSIYHSPDGGTTWKRMRDGNDFTKPRYHLQDICFTDALHGYAAGEDGLLIYTNDGGQHWMEYDRFTSSTLRCIIAQKDGSLFVCGDNGAFFRLKPSGF